MRDYPPMPDPPLNTAARPILAPSEGLFMGLALSGSSSSSSSPSIHRPSIHPPPLLPIKESPLAPKLEPRLDLSMPNLPQKTRKRHKVATSCNRCRQNKRKCDSGIPCSNCRRNKADCLYTDAQLSRSTWGDSPLSREKIIGVSTAEMLEMDSQLVNSTEATVSGSGSQAASRGSLKSPDKPSSSIKKGSTCRKGSTVPISNALASPAHMATFSSSSTASFNPGHASIDPTSAFDRRKEQLASQTREIAKVIRIAKPGPQLDLSNIIAPRNPGPALSVQPTIKDHHNYPFAGLESPHSNATQSTTPDHGRFLASVSTHSPSKISFHQVTDTTQSLSSLPQQAQHALQIQQARQGNLGGLITSTTQLPLSYQDGGTNEEFVRLSSLVRSRGDLSTAIHEHQNGVAMVSPGGEGRIPLHQSSNLQPSSSGLSNPSVQQQRHGGLSQSSVLQEQTSHHQYFIQHHHHQQQQQEQQSASPSPNLGIPPLQQQYPYPQQAAQDSGKLADSNHAISSAAPVSSIGVASQFPSQGGWGTPSYSIHAQNGQVGWKESGIPHQSTGYSDQSIISQSVSHSHQQHILHTHAPVVTVEAVVPTPVTTPSFVVDERTDAMRMRRIARDMLDCKAYDYSIMLPRHISQEQDEIWVAPQSIATSNSLQGIPRQLLMLPKDANFLADVFFEHAYFYYPIINRAIVELHLMEPHTPQALLLLNIVFMGACKHLGRSTDIKRAIQFRERAREIQHYIDGRVRITGMQATLLGAQVIYGVFVPVMGLSVICGTYRALRTIDTVNVDENEAMIDLAAESHSLAANRGLIPEAAYQQRLWTFWGLYTREAMGRLYFGWPHGIDPMIVDSELPKIKGCVGLGGTRRSLNGNSGLDAAATGKRRGPIISKKQAQREKKLLKAEAAAKQSGREVYRMALSPGSDDEDDDDEEAEDQEDESDLEQDNVTVIGASQNESGLPEKNRRFKLNSTVSAETSASTSHPYAKDQAFSFSGLSKQLLERQSRGEDLTRRQGVSGSGSSYSAQVRRHMDRMEMLLDAEEDITDGGSYARILFLEEVKLWSIGRRVGLYLQGRSTSHSGSPAAAVTGSFSPYDKLASSDAARCSESAWRDDKELQALQAELIAWDQALPSMFKFRQDLEQPDINHKVNGRLSVLRMYYYSITIMLQSSYLPIPQYLLSSARSTATKSPESISQEYDGLFSRAASMTGSEEGGPRIKSEAEEYFQTGRSPQPSNSNGYFNTPHRMCTQLSNVLFHHIELMMDSYPNWCSIQIKVNQSLTAAIRVSCLNARLSSNSKAIREEAKAGFKMGSELFKRLALLPEPLTVRDWPAEEDVQVMLNLEEEFKELMTTQDEELAREEARSRSQTRDDIDHLELGHHGDPGDHLLYTPELQDGGHDGLSFETTVQPQYDIFGFNTEGFQFSYGLN